MNSMTKVAGVPRWDPRSRTLAIALSIAAAAFYLTYLGTYFSWGDEVQFVDPAASLYFGQGFTSSAWPYQTSTEFFAGNAPGYSLLLWPWFSIWGFGLEQARLLNLPLAVGAVLLIAAGIRRLMPAVPGWLIAIMMFASLLGAGALVSGGSARYDFLGLLVASWVFFLLSHGSGNIGYFWLVMAGAATFYAGFHLVAALVIFLVLLGFQTRGKYLNRSYALVMGVFFGMTSWLVVLATKGLFVKFFVMLFGSQHTISGQLAKLMLQGDRGVLSKFDALRALASLDLSLTIIGVFIVVMLLSSVMQQSRAGSGENVAPALGEERLIAWLAVDFAFLLPIMLLIIGKFPIYYTWIAYVPAVVIAGIWAWRRYAAGIRWPVVLFVMACLLSATLGITGRIHQRDENPRSRDYANFNAWVHESLSRDDWVYTQHEAYFGARTIASKVFVPTYGQTALVRGIPERDRIGVLLVRRDHVNESIRLLGGEWSEKAHFDSPSSGLGSRKLAFVLLRRR